MIVDNEERVRTRIKTLINWQDYDICVISEGADGAEALELLALHHVDILITEIRIPEVDGLSLIRKVSEKYPHIKCIILSGYSDFNYAQQAMHLGANHYLLKSSTTQEILESVLKLVNRIQRRNKQNAKLKLLHKGFNESFPLLKEKVLSKLILSEGISYEHLLNKLKIGGTSFSHPYFGLLRIQTDNINAPQECYDTGDADLLKYALKNISEETLSEVSTCGTFEDQDDIIVILNSPQKLDASQLLPFVIKLNENVRHYLKISISVGISGIDKPVNQLKNAHIQAADALDARIFAGPGKIINYEEEFKTTDSRGIESTYPIELEKLILQSVLSGKESNIKENIMLFQCFLNRERDFKDQVLKFTFNLYFSLYSLCVERNLSTNKIFKQNLNEITLKFTRSNIETIYEEILSIALLVGKQLNEKKSNHKLLESILEFIRQNYHKNISRDKVASEVYITPSYLSVLFKQQLNMSFLEFLHKIRLEKACELLKDSKKRVADIALQVGYNDEKYFFQVFKKYMKMTPKQFRNISNN